MGETMKTWEETWDARPFNQLAGGCGCTGGYEVTTDADGHVAATFDTGRDPDPAIEARAKLAAAAPDMARVLLGIIERSEERVNCLGECLGRKLRYALVDALRKAGVEHRPVSGDWADPPETRYP